MDTNEPRALLRALVERELRKNTGEVFGREHKHRRVRIMVTLPAEAAGDGALTRDLLLAGTDCFRINCAHDDAAAWERMIRNIRSAEAETGRQARISMELAGQKPRTLEVLLPEPEETGGRETTWPESIDPGSARRPAAPPRRA